MIELEDHGIGLAAIDAGPRREVVEQQTRSLSPQFALSLMCSRDVLGTVREVVLAPVFRLAGSAVMLPLPFLSAVPRELLE